MGASQEAKTASQSNMNLTTLEEQTMNDMAGSTGAETVRIFLNNY